MVWRRIGLAVLAFGLGVCSFGQEATSDSAPRIVGYVTDEKQQPLLNVLVALTAEPVTNIVSDPETAAELCLSLSQMPHGDALLALKERYPNVVDFTFSNNSGEFSFPRSLWSGKTSPITSLQAFARNRLPAFYYLYIVNEEQKDPTQDYLVPTIILPATTWASGVVNAPPQIPDVERPGQFLPMKDGESYSVSAWDTRPWFGQYIADRVGWQYEQSAKTFKFGEPFVFQVPRGTSFTLSARPVNTSLPLCMHLWREKPADKTSVLLAPATLRALQPFTLRLTYSDGTPAANFQLSGLYIRENNNKTNEQGETIIYGDEGLSPEFLAKSPHQYLAEQRFKNKRLDMSTTPLPSLTLALEPRFEKPNPIDPTLKTMEVYQTKADGTLTTSLMAIVDDTEGTETKRYLLPIH